MKRFLSILCSALMLMQLLPSSVLAEEIGWTLQLPASTTTVGVEAFTGDPLVRSVVIPATMREVGSRAFDGCTGLESVSIEPGAELILMPGAFANCPNFRQLVIGDGCYVILCAGLFAGCDGAFDIYVSRNSSLLVEDGALECDGEITFHVYQGSPEELYALSHGYVTESLDSASALEQARQMVAAYGVAPSVLQSGSPYKTMRLIVKTNEGHLPDISEYTPASIARKGTDTYFVQFGTEMDAIDCAEYMLEMGVESVEPDMLMATNLPFYENLPDEIHAASITDLSAWGTDDPIGFDYYSDYVSRVDGDHSVTIAVIDSGITRGNGYDDILLTEAGRNYASDGEYDEWYRVYNYHGSIVASIIKSCVGDANVRIIPIRIEEASGLADAIMLGEAIDYAVEQGVDIINLSLYLDVECEHVDQALDRAINAGVRVVAAAGNDNGPVADIYPANRNDVIAVAGVKPGNRLTDTTASGVGIDYSAPGASITHTLPGSPSDGTSFAAPQIASALALLELDPNHAVADMKAVCTPIEGGGAGMPLLDQLAQIPTAQVRFGSDTPTVMSVGSEHALSWTVQPKKATDKSVTITSDNEAVVAVQNDGGVALRALQPGSAQITLAANDGASPAVRHDITVVQPVERIELESDSVRSWYNAETHGDPIAYTAQIAPEDATNKAIAWYSTNTAVATVDQNGTVTPRGPGRAMIIASALDGYGAFGSRMMTVAEYPDAEGIVITDGESTAEAVAFMGKPLQLTGTVFPETAQQIIDWTVVEGTGSATVSEAGLVTPEAAGTVTVQAAARSDPSTVAEFHLDIVPAPASATASVGTASLYPGAKTTMDIAVAPQGAYMPGIIWHSTNPQVLTVDPATGEVTAVQYGSASVYAEVDATATERTTLTGGIERVTIPDAAVFDTNQVQIEVKAAPTITFNANGGSVSPPTKKVYQGREVGELPTPNRGSDWRFDGWFTRDNTLFQADTVCDSSHTEDFTLYAHWTPLTFTVTFNLNRPTNGQNARINGASSMTATVNQPLGTLPGASCDYYTFQGWYTESYGGTRVWESQTYPTANNVVLYAHWAEKGWSATYETDQLLEESWYRVYVDSRQVAPVYRYHYSRHRYQSGGQTWTTYGNTGTYEEITVDSPMHYLKTYEGKYNEYEHLDGNGNRVYTNGAYKWYYEEQISVKQGYTVHIYKDRTR